MWVGRGSRASIHRAAQEPTLPAEVHLANGTRKLSDMPYRGPEGFSWHSSDVSARRRALAAVVLLGAGWAIGFFAGRMSAWLFPVVETNTAVVANVAPPPAASTPPAAQPPAAPPQRDAAQAPAAPQAAAPPTESSTSARNSPDGKAASRAEPSSGERTGAAPDKAPPPPDASAPAAQTPGLPPDKSEPAQAQRAASAPTPKDASREQDASRSPDRDFVLVNPEWKQAPSKAGREPEPERRAYRPEPDAGQDRLADESALAKCESRYSSFSRSDGTYQPYGRSTREPCPFLSDMPRRRQRY
jgi:hypothetical protein